VSGAKQSPKPPTTLGEGVDRCRCSAGCDVSSAVTQVVADIIRYRLLTEGVPVREGQIVLPFEFQPTPAEFWGAVQANGNIGVDALRSEALVGTNGFRHIRVIPPPEPEPVTPPPPEPDPATPRKRSGRPPSDARVLIEAEAKLRAEAGMREPTPYAEAAALRDWLLRAHPKLEPPLTLKTVQNILYGPLKWLGNATRKSD
jgi:hypothetical protein